MNDHRKNDSPERRGNDDTGPTEHLQRGGAEPIMHDTTDTRPAANYSRARRRHVIGLIRRDRVFDMPPAARLIYVVGALIADDHGYLPEAALHSALRDASIVQAARELLRKAAA